MTQQAELLKTMRQLQDLKRTRPEIYNVIVEALELPQAEYEEFIRQTMPILKKYMN